MILAILAGIIVRVPFPDDRNWRLAMTGCRDDGVVDGRVSSVGCAGLIFSRNEDYR
jgi:hypothetical protein